MAFDNFDGEKGFCGCVVVLAILFIAVGLMVTKSGIVKDGNTFDATAAIVIFSVVGIMLIIRFINKKR